MKLFSDKDISKELEKCRKKALFFTFLHCFYSFLLIAFAYASKSVINCAIDRISNNLTLWIVILVVVGLLIPVSKGFSNYISYKYSDEQVAIVRSLLFSKLLKKDSLSLSALKNGEVFNRLMTDCRSVVSYYTFFIPEVTGQFLQLGGSLLLILIIKPLIGLVILGLGSIAFLGMILIRKLLKKEEKKVLKSFDQVTSFVSEGVENVETIKIIADSREVTSRLEAKQNNFLESKKKLRILGISSNSLFSLAVQILSIGLIVYGSFNVADHKMTYGDFAALVELVALFKSPISALTTIPSTLANFDACHDRLDSLLKVKEENEEIKVDSSSIEAFEFENVSFGYTNEPVIKNFNSIVKISELSQFDGESGKGKTTLFKLILGIYSPNSGKIYCLDKSGNRTDITNYSRVSLFNYVPQSCLVFAGTLFDNLKLSNPNLSKEEAVEALKKVNLSNFSLDYVIKENNEGLSRGEAQRLCIARAMISKKPFLILDEATSSLDKENSTKIIETITSSFKGILIASHKDNEFKKTKKIEL